MPIIDYSKTVIYKIQCKDASVKFVYIGSSTDVTKQKYYHKRNSKQNKQDNLSIIINNHGGWDNWELKILEKYSCNNKQEAIDKENEWKEILNSEVLKEQFSVDTNKPELNTSEIKCIYCMKTFSRKDNLTRHNSRCKIINASINKIDFDFATNTIDFNINNSHIINLEANKAIASIKELL